MSQFTWIESASIDKGRTGLASMEFAVPLLWQYSIAFVLLSAFRLGGLTHQSLWFDEGYTLHLASANSFAEFLRIFGSYTTSEHLQPLYYVVMYGWSRFAGVSDVALRLPSALFSIGSGLCLFAMLRLIADRAHRAYALMGVGLFSISSYSVYYAQEARPYACVQFCSFLFLLAWLVQARQQYQTGKTSRAAKAFLVFASVLVCLSSVFGALLLFSLAVADLYRFRREVSAWWNCWSMSGLTSALAVALYASFAVRSFPSVVAKDIVGLKQPLWMNAAYALFGTMFGTTLGPSTTDLHGPHKLALLLHALPVLVCAGLVIVAMAWALTRMAASSSLPFYAKVGGATAAVYAALLFGCFGIVGKLNILPRHASALFAVCVLTLSACVLTRSVRGTRTARIVLVLALGGAFILNAVSISRSIYAASCRKDDYRAVAAALSQKNLPIYLTSGQTELLEHYGLNVHSAVDVPPAQLADYLQEASNASQQILVLTNTFRNYRWDGAEPVEAMLQPAYACVPHSDYAFFRVLSCSLRADGTLHRKGMTNE